MLGVDGLQRALAGCLKGRTELVAQLLNIVEQHRGGPPADDTLVVEVTRRIGDRLTDGGRTGSQSSRSPGPASMRDGGSRVDAGSRV
jgi:hypothetical protein